MMNNKFYIPEINKPDSILPLCPISSYLKNMMAIGHKGVGIESNRYVYIPVKDEYGVINTDKVYRLKENGSLHKQILEMGNFEKLPKCWIVENKNENG